VIYHIPCTPGIYCTLVENDMAWIYKHNKNYGYCQKGQRFYALKSGKKFNEFNEYPFNMLFWGIKTEI
ncbi:MAG: hypothetical protein ACEY3H_07345, partial [Wolbachia sp.]